MERWVHRSKARPGGQNADIGRLAETPAVVAQPSSWRKWEECSVAHGTSCPVGRWRPAVFSLLLPGSSHTIQSRETAATGPAPAFTSAITPSTTAALMM